MDPDKMISIKSGRVVYCLDSKGQLLYFPTKCLGSEIAGGYHRERYFCKVFFGGFSHFHHLVHAGKMMTPAKTCSAQTELGKQV